MNKIKTIYIKIIDEMRTSLMQLFNNEYKSHIFLLNKNSDCESFVFLHGNFGIHEYLRQFEKV